MPRIKVAFVASTLDVGGAEKVVFDLVTQLPVRDRRVSDTGFRYETAFYFLKGRGVVGEELSAMGYAVTDRLQTGRYHPGVLFKLVGGLRAFSPDVLFILDHHNAILWGGLAGLFSGVRHRVIASHATGRMGGRPSFNTLDRTMVRSASTVVALSESHAAYLRDREGIPEARLVVIENGIDCEGYSGADREAVERVRRELRLGEEDHVVIMVAALRPEKAHEALLATAAELAGSPDPWRFLIVGDGERRAALERRVTEMGLGERVHFLGERRDVPVLLALSSVLVLPSHGAVETLPLAILEAMAAGVPVVASAVGSVPEVIENDVNGKLIAPADANGLAAALRDIIKGRAKTAQMAENARDTVRARYTRARMVSRYQELFESLVKQTR